MDLTPTPAPDIILSERCDLRAANVIAALAGYVEPEPGALDHAMRCGFRGYIKAMTKAGGRLTVVYSAPAIGRYTTELDSGERMVTQDGLPNKVKGAICARDWVDVDMVNCHPVLLEQILRKERLPCEQLRKLVTDRARLIKETGLTKNVFKKLVFSLVLYQPGATEQQVARKLKEFKLEKEPESFRALREEIKGSVPQLLERYPAYMKEAQRKRAADNRAGFNEEGTALSLLVQTQERRCITALCEYPLPV